MSHITIIISKSTDPAPAGTRELTAAEHAESMAVSYEYVIPVPHGASSHEVGKLVQQAFKRLEIDS